MQQSLPYFLRHEALLQQTYQKILSRFELQNCSLHTWLCFLYSQYLSPTHLTWHLDKYDLVSSNTVSEEISSFIKLNHKIMRFHSEFLEQNLRRFRCLKYQQYSKGAMRAAKVIGQEIEGLQKRLMKREELQKEIKKLERGEDIEYELDYWNKRVYELEEYLEISQNNNEQFMNILNRVAEKNEHFYSKLIIYRNKLIKMRTLMLEYSIRMAENLIDSIQQTVVSSHYWITHSLAKINKLQLIPKTKKTSSSIATISSITSLDHNDFFQIHKQYSILLHKLKLLFLHEQQPSSYSSRQILEKILLQNKQALIYFREIQKDVLKFVDMKIEIRKQIEKTIGLMDKISQNAVIQNQVVDILYGKKQNQSLENFQSAHQLVPISAKEDSLMNELMKNLLFSIKKKLQSFIRFSIVHFKSDSSSFISLSHKSKRSILKFSVSPHEIEKWLWKDFRDFESPKKFFIKPCLEQKIIKNKLLEIKQILDVKVGEDKIQCSLKEYKGISNRNVAVQISKAGLVIIFRSDKNDVIIPKSHLKQIIKHHKSFEIKTLGGISFNFEKMQRQDASKLQKLQKLLYENRNQQSGRSSIKLINLSEEQKQVMPRREQKINQIIPNYSIMQKFAQKTFQTNIQKFYQIILSDEPSFTFFHYFNQQIKNSHFKITPYNQPGPKYFTGNAQSSINFTNAPQYSQRTAQFDYMMPKIPFLPKECHCVQKSKIYWISHKYLVYKSQVTQVSPPMIEGLQTAYVYHIVDHNNEVTIKVFGEIKYPKNMKFGGILVSQGMIQIKKVIPQLLEAMQDFIRMQADEKQSKQKRNDDKHRIQESKVKEKNEDKVVRSRDQVYMGWCTIFLILFLNLCIHYLLRQQ